MPKKRASRLDNRIDLSFDEAVDRLLSTDPKKLSPAVQPGKPKAKKAATKRRPKHNRDNQAKG